MRAGGGVALWSRRPEAAMHAIIDAIVHAAMQPTLPAGNACTQPPQ